MLQFDRFARRSFDVIAIKITAENFDEVAEWCGGEIKSIDRVKGKPDTRYIKVNVERPQYHQNVRAYNGDWIVRGSETSFKVYRDQQFQKTFRRSGIDNSSAVIEIVKKAMYAQDAASYRGDMFQSEALIEAVEAIVGLIDGTTPAPPNTKDRERHDKILEILEKNGAGVHMPSGEIAIQIMGI
jgi:hypothetical protein